MSKKIRIEDTPEFKYFEEHQDEILKELEEDEKVKDLEIPEEWDIAFKQTIQDTFEEKRRAKKRRIRKILVAVTTFFVVAGFGTNYTLVRVEGVGIAELIQKAINSSGSRHSVYSVDEENYEMLPENEVTDIYFEGTTISDVLDKVRTELKVPMFCFDNILDEFEVKEAKYNKTYRVLNIELEKNGSYIFISQEIAVTESTSGTITDEKALALAQNKSLDKEIPIYQSKQHEYFLFDVKVDHTIFSFNGDIALEECIQVAEKLSFN